jgi:FkbM family methyltransferase
MVEPREHLRVKSQDLCDKHNIEWITAGCSDEPGVLPLFIGYPDYNSTFRAGNTQDKPTVNVPVKTLDQIANGRIPDIVKVDAEGFDLKVLHGAKTLLGKTDLFLVEAMACGDADNTAHLLISFMVAQGYSLMEITDLNRSGKTGALWLVELAFARRDSALWRECRSGYS